MGKSQYRHLQQQLHQPRMDMVVVVQQHSVVEVEDQVAVQAVEVVVLWVEDRPKCNRESQQSHLR